MENKAVINRLRYFQKFILLQLGHILYNNNFISNVVIGNTFYNYTVYCLYIFIIKDNVDNI